MITVALTPVVVESVIFPLCPKTCTDTSSDEIVVEVGCGVGTTVGVGIGMLVGGGIGTSVGAGIGMLVGAGTGTPVGLSVGYSRSREEVAAVATASQPHDVCRSVVKLPSVTEPSSESSNSASKASAVANPSAPNEPRISKDTSAEPSSFRLRLAAKSTAKFRMSFGFAPASFPTSAPCTFANVKALADDAVTVSETAMPTVSAEVGEGTGTSVGAGMGIWVGAEGTAVGKGMGTAVG